MTELEELAASACPSCVRIVDRLEAMVETREAEIKRLNAGAVALGNQLVELDTSLNAALYRATAAASHAQALANELEGYKQRLEELEGYKQRLDELEGYDPIEHSVTGVTAQRIAEIRQAAHLSPVGDNLLRDAYRFYLLVRRAWLHAESEFAEEVEKRAAAATRAANALDILRTPGSWSDFASRAIKALEGK